MWHLATFLTKYLEYSFGTFLCELIWAALKKKSSAQRYIYIFQLPDSYPDLYFDIVF